MAATSRGAVLTDQHRRDQVRMAITADSQARRAWDGTLDLNDLKGSQPVWKNTIMRLIETWWRVSARTAANYIPRFREAEIGEGIEVAVPEFDRSRVAREVDWTGAVNVLWHISRGETAAAAYVAARSLFLGIFHEAVLDGGRMTVREMAKRDTRAIGWRRVSDGDPCAFCAMLVTRGPVYTSEQHALSRQSDMLKYHPHCGCTCEIVYGDWAPTDLEKKWIDDYYTAAESLPKDTPRTPDLILPIMRESGLYHDSPKNRTRRK